MKNIVLLSGGLDSAVAAGMVKERQGDACLALFFDYGQRHLEREMGFSIWLAEHFGWDWQRIQVPFKFDSSLTGKGSVTTIIKSFPASFVPGRNLVFLSYASSLAYVNDSEWIAGGWNFIDYSGYPDCRPEFLSSAERTISLAISREIKIYSPLLFLTKKDIIKEGLRLGVPFEYTWSCYEGGSNPCGVCGSCKYRAKGFAELGMEDPLMGR